MTDKFIQLTAALHQYVLNHSLRETECLQQLRNLTATLPGAQMQIAPEQGQFMALLIKLMNAKQVLELGTFTGYSALVMALALPEDGQLITCDINQETTTVAKNYWQKASVAHKIQSRLAHALDVLDNLLTTSAECFDFIFIDADKQNYPIYYEKSLLLLRRGGLIVLDNMLQKGEVLEKNTLKKSVLAIHQLNQKLLTDQRVFLSLLPIADGLTLLRKY